MVRGGLRWLVRIVVGVRRAKERAIAGLEVLPNLRQTWHVMRSDRSEGAIAQKNCEMIRDHFSKQRASFGDVAASWSCVRCAVPAVQG
jgi:hypothetical protein